jgi:hypothetical protein
MADAIGSGGIARTGRGVGRAPGFPVRPRSGETGRRPLRREVVVITIHRMTRTRYDAHGPRIETIPHLASDWHVPDCATISTMRGAGMIEIR